MLRFLSKFLQDRAGAQFGKMILECSNVWSNGHPVVIKDNGDVQPDFSRMVQRFPTHAARNRGVSRNGDDALGAALEVSCGSKANSRRNCRSRMSRSKGIQRVLVPLQEAAETLVFA